MPNTDTTERTTQDSPGSARKAAHAAIAAACLALAAGCSVGPDFKRPEMTFSKAFKENPGWKTAAPDDGAKRGPWWEMFRDPVLSKLEEQVSASNETVIEAIASYEEARQTVRSDRTGYLPTVTAAASGERTRSPSYQSAASSYTTTTTTSTGTTTSTTTIPLSRGLTSNLFTPELEASWEPDIWGKLRRTVEADVATAQASAADLALARLSMQATLAQDYIDLRVADDQMRLLENAIKGYERTLKITQNKYAVGVSARSDIITAQTQLDSTKAQLIAQGITRAQYEHAIAVLLGKAPADFSIARRPDIGLAMPDVPPQLASTLLERRPDIAAAERAAAAANARIGVQVAAYYPSFSLSATGGFEAPQLQNILSAPYRFWTLGLDASDSLLDWGQRHDQVLGAKAAYAQTAAAYRQTVLTALQQVEDALAGLRILGDEAKVQDTAVSEAALASKIAINEYNAGTVDFTTVVTAEVTELTNRQTLLGVVQNQLTTSVALIQALGGGWTMADLPKP